MILENEIIDNHVKFRMGKAYDSTFDVPKANLIDNNVPSLAFIDIGSSNTILPSHFETRIKKVENKWYLAPKYQNEKKQFYRRTTKFINTLEKFNCQVPILVNLSDAQDYYYNCLDKYSFVPVFQYNRKTNREDIILFPLEGYYMSPGSHNVSIPSNDINWSEKIPKAIWRGSLSGIFQSHSSAGIGSKIWAAGVWKKILTKEVPVSISYLALLQFPRFRLVDMYLNDEDIDVGLTISELNSFKTKDKCDVLDFLKKYTKPSLSKEKMIRYKYLIAVEGNDVSSSLPWQFLSNSLVLMPKPKWETIFNLGIKEWENYVPIADDFSDLEQKLDWCKNNDDECKKISERASSYMSQFLDEELMERINKEVLQRYANNICSY